jgi:beta-RFAP synthase
MMIRVTTGSRLHFGLFSVPHLVPAAGARQFGGVGLMVEQPGLTLRLQPANCWSVSGPINERTRRLAQQIVQAFSIAESFEVHVDSCPDEHVGLGTGTQLSLALALAITEAAGRQIDVLDLARQLGRGQRSALGIHGFIHGGFLVEGGKGAGTLISPLIARAEFPEDWRVLLVLSSGKPGCHGQAETQAFAELAQLEGGLLTTVESQLEVLCRLTLLGMLPALHDADLTVFGDSLYEFNRRVGEMFRPVQAGIYSHPGTEEVVDYLRREGVHGAGQSSWGPTVFAVTEADRAEHLARLLRQRFCLRESEVIVTSGRNEGARILP